MGKPTTRESFLALLTPRGECLEYQGRRDSHGYGATSYRSKPWRAHRLVWVLANGPIPDGLLVLHHCDNPPCCRLSHLYLGTHADNEADAQRRGRIAYRSQPGERNPAARLTQDQVRLIRELAAGGVSRRALGRQFGIAPQTATKIVNRRKWASVP